MPTKKQRLAARNNSLIELGTWKDLPHMAVIGRQTDFYLWHHRDASFARNTVWITGKEAFDLHAKLKDARLKGKDEFKKLFLEEFNKRPKMYE